MENMHHPPGRSLYADNFHGATNKWQSDHNQTHSSKIKIKQIDTISALIRILVEYNLQFKMCIHPVVSNFAFYFCFCFANACFMASQYTFFFPPIFLFSTLHDGHNLIQFSQYERSPIYKINYNYIQLIVVT